MGMSFCIFLKICSEFYLCAFPKLLRQVLSLTLLLHASKMIFNDLKRKGNPSQVYAQPSWLCFANANCLLKNFILTSVISSLVQHLRPSSLSRLCLHSPWLYFWVNFISVSNLIFLRSKIYAPFWPQSYFWNSILEPVYEEQ